MKLAKPFEVNVSSKFGAPLGRHSDNVLEGKVHLQKVPFYDGDYDKGGAYWGSGGGPLYCAWNEDGAFYVRAENREHAKKKLTSFEHANLDVTFYR